MDVKKLSSGFKRAIVEKFSFNSTVMVVVKAAVFVKGIKRYYIIKKYNAVLKICEQNESDLMHQCVQTTISN